MRCSRRRDDLAPPFFAPYKHQQRQRGRDGKCAAGRGERGPVCFLAAAVWWRQAVAVGRDSSSRSRLGGALLRVGPEVWAVADRVEPVWKSTSELGYNIVGPEICFPRRFEQREL